MQYLLPAPWLKREVPSAGAVKFAPSRLLAEMTIDPTAVGRKVVDVMVRNVVGIDRDVVGVDIVASVVTVDEEVVGPGLSSSITSCHMAKSAVAIRMPSAPAKAVLTQKLFSHRRTPVADRGPATPRKDSRGTGGVPGCGVNRDERRLLVDQLPRRL